MRDGQIEFWLNSFPTEKCSPTEVKIFPGNVSFTQNLIMEKVSFLWSLSFHFDNVERFSLASSFCFDYYSKIFNFNNIYTSFDINWVYFQMKNISFFSKKFKFFILNKYRNIRTSIFQPFLITPDTFITTLAGRWYAGEK